MGSVPVFQRVLLISLSHSHLNVNLICISIFRNSGCPRKIMNRLSNVVTSHRYARFPQTDNCFSYLYNNFTNLVLKSSKWSAVATSSCVLGSPVMAINYIIVAIMTKSLSNVGKRFFRSTTHQTDRTAKA